MKKKQLARLGVTLGLVAAVGVGGTLALLTAETEEVTNTFTVGDGLKDTDLELDETDVKNPESTRVKRNVYENLTPSMSLVKDPQVRISAAAADCYAFIKVSGVDEFLTAMGGEDEKYAQITNWNSGWKLKDKENENAKYDGIYYWQPDKDAAEGLKVSVGNEKFSQFVFEGIALGKDAALYNADGSKKDSIPEIKIDACAVQAAGDKAWSNAVESLPEEFK